MSDRHLRGSGDRIIQTRLYFDCDVLRGLCGLICYEQQRCDWELAAWGLMRGSVRAHGASKAKAQTHRGER